MSLANYVCACAHLQGLRLCAYQLLAPLSPLGHWVGMGRDLTKSVIKCFTLWAGQAIKSLPNPCSLQGIMWGFDNFKGQIPHPWGTSSVQNRGKSPCLSPMLQGG